MKRHRVFYHLLICLLLLPLLQAANPEVKKALDEYRQVVDDMASMRTLRFDQGTPSDLYFSGEDEQGYQWYTRLFYGVDIIRFNGHHFEDMFERYPPAEKDSLLGILHTSDGRVYSYGRHHLYRWEGYRWQAFAFPAGDEIRNAQASNNQVMCIGKYGYSVLNESGFNYYEAKELQEIDEGYVYRYATVDESGIPVNYELSYSVNSFKSLYLIKHKQYCSFLQVDFDEYRVAPAPCHFDSDQYLYIYGQGRADSLLALTADEANRYYKRNIIIEPRLYQAPDGSQWLYYRNTDMLWKIDSRDNKLLRMGLPHDYQIRTIHQVTENRETESNSGFKGSSETRDYLVATGTKALILSELISSKVKPQPIASHEFPDNFNQKTQQCLLNIGGRTIGFTSIDNPMETQGWLLIKYDPTVKKLIRFDHPFPAAAFESSTGISIQHSIYGSALCWTHPLPDLPGCHKVSVMDLITGKVSERQLADASDELEILNYDERANTMLVGGSEQYYLMPMERSINRLRPKQVNKYYESISSAITKREDLIILEDNLYKEFMHQGKRYQIIKKGLISPLDLPTLSNIRAYNQKTSTLLFEYPSKDHEENQLASMNPLTGQITPITSYNGIHKRLVHDRQSLMLIDRDLNCEMWSNQPNKPGVYELDRSMKTKNLATLNRILKPLLGKYGLNAGDLLHDESPLLPQLLPGNQVFFQIPRSITATIVSEGDSFKITSAYNLSFPHLSHCKLDQTNDSALAQRINWQSDT